MNTKIFTFQGIWWDEVRFLSTFQPPWKIHSIQAVRIVAVLLLALLPSLALAQAPLTPIQKCMAQLQKDTAAYDSASGSLAAATSAVTSLSCAASNAQTAVAADMAALAALTNTPVVNPTPVIVPPVVPTLSVLAVSATWCGPCNTMHQQVQPLIDAGLPLSFTNDQADYVKYGVTSFPTLIAMYGDKEVTRHIGAIDAAAMKDWYTKLVAYVQQYPPK